MMTGESSNKNNKKTNSNKNLPTSIIERAKNFNSQEHKSLDNMVENFTKSLTITSDQIENVEKLTRSQSKSKEWFTQRKGRLTASAFGRIFKRMETVKSNKNENPEKLINYLLSDKKIDTLATRHGVAMEPHAKLAVKNVLKEQGTSKI